MELSIRLHLADLSLSNTVRKLEMLDVKRSRKAVHDWVHKCDLQPADDESPNHVVLNETVIQLDEHRYWLYTAVDPPKNKILYIRLYSTATTALTERFLQELMEKHDLGDAVFLVDGAKHLQTALRRSGLRFRYEKHGNRNAVERVFREIKRRTSSFSNCFSHAQPSTAESSGLRRLAQCYKYWRDSEHQITISSPDEISNNCLLSSKMIIR